MAVEDIIQVIYKYSKDIEYGEVILRIKFHRGEAVEVEEVQPPIKRYRLKKNLDKLN